MKADNKPKKKLITSRENPLLNIKEVMDLILKEAEGIPANVRQSLVQSRNIVWGAFVEAQEKVNNSLK